MRLADTPVAASAAKRPGRSGARFWIAELVPFLVGIAAWQALSSLNVWPRVLFPSPLEVGQAFVEDISAGVLLVNLGVSLKRLLLGFIVGSAIAIPLGYLMGLNRASRDFFDPLVNLLQAIPGLAWIPFAILGCDRSRACATTRQWPAPRWIENAKGYSQKMKRGEDREETKHVQACISRICVRACRSRGRRSVSSTTTGGISDYRHVRPEGSVVASGLVKLPSHLQAVGRDGGEDVRKWSRWRRCMRRPFAIRCSTARPRMPARSCSRKACRCGVAG